MSKIDGVWYLYRHSVIQGKPVLKDRLTKIEVAVQVNGNLKTTFQRKDGDDPVELKKAGSHTYYLGHNKGRYRVELAALGKLAYLKGYAKASQKDGDEVDVFFGLRDPLSGKLTSQPIGTFPWNSLPLDHKENLPHETGHKVEITDKIVIVTLKGGTGIKLPIGTTVAEDNGWSIKAAGGGGYQKFECWFLPVGKDDKPLFCGQLYDYTASKDTFEPVNNPEKCSQGSTGGEQGR